MELKDKCAIVTGGAMGIGLATSKRLLMEGAVVTLWDLNKTALQQAKEELSHLGKVFIHQCDVTNKEQVYKLAKTAKKEMGKVDILINNAGFVSGGEFLERPDEEWERTIDVNLTALLYTTKAFLAGITLIATGIALILFDGSLLIIKKLKHLALFFLTGISLVLINLIRNHYASGTLSGVREKAIRSVADNLLDIGAVLGRWFPFIGEHALAGAIVFCLLVVFAALQIIYRMMQQQFYTKIETVVYGFFLVYSIFIVVISSISRFEELSSRLLSPMYVPMIWVATSWVPDYIQKRTKNIRILMLIGAVIIFIAFFKNQYHQNADNWEGIAYAGIPGYSEKQWKESPTIKYINAHKDSMNAAIYSDANDGLFYLTGVKSFPLPHKEIEIEKKKFLDHPTLIVVWFNDGVNNDLIDLDFINKHKNLKATKRFEDGVMYFYSDSLTVKQ